MFFFEVAVFIIILALATNAVVAFLIAFYWQGTVILTLLKEMVSADGPNPWRAYDLGSGVNMFNRFVAGEILPELRKSGLKRSNTLF